MTKDEIMEMAYEAGIEEAYSLRHDQVLVKFKSDSLERFAALVEAKATEKEREAVFDLVDDYAKGNTDLRDAIRARGNSETE